MVVERSSMFSFMDTSGIRRLIIWRCAYSVLLTLLALPFVVFENRELGPETGWYLIVGGVAPSVILIAAARVNRMLACWIALVHDSLLLIGFVALAVMSETLGLVVLSPLAAFPIEGVILLSVLWTRRAIGSA